MTTSFIMNPVEPLYVGKKEKAGVPIVVVPNSGSFCFTTFGAEFAFWVSYQQIKDLCEWMETNDQT